MAGKHGNKVVSLPVRGPNSTKKSGGNGGGTTVTPETQRYVDARTEATRAQNDAKFAEVIAKIDGFPKPLTWQQAAAVVATGIGIVLAILAFAGDRFDGGMAVTTDAATTKEIVSQNSKNIEALTESVDKMISAQAIENQKMIDALADHHEGQKGFEAPE